MENCSWNDDTEWQELPLQKKDGLHLSSLSDKTLQHAMLSVLPCCMMIDLYSEALYLNKQLLMFSLTWQGLAMGNSSKWLGKSSHLKSKNLSYSIA